MGRRIRIWKPGAMYHVTLECVDRMFLLKPSAKLNNAVGETLGRALELSPVDLHSATTNINHMELLLSLREEQVANASNFLRNFAGQTARSANKLLEREGHFWSGRARVEEVKSDRKAEKLLGYGACNTVKDGLVENASHWKGFSTTKALSRGEDTMTFTYVDRSLWWKHGAGQSGDVDPTKYTRKTEIKLTPIPSWQRLKHHQRATRFRHLIRDYEKKAREEREADGITGVKGMARIEQESPFSKPRSPRRRTFQPLCHVDTREEYRLYQEEHREISSQHRKASLLYRSGYFEAEFPPGTFRPPLVTVFGWAA
jgi:REP element-mobilizing transposase RayT